jgi:phosphate ABC transporter permease subunit PstA
MIWSTILITGGAVLISLFSALFVAVFIVEFAPQWMANVLQPVVRFLASVPSVIYGLIGVVVLVPLIGNHLVTEDQKASVAGVISLTGYSLLAAVTVLTVMIAPLMVSIFSDGLRSVKPGWLEGSLALGVNRWRTVWKIGVRTARPAIVAGTVLATARAIGEAVMLAMISGSVAFAPNPADGLIFIYEPSRPLAPTIVKNIDQLSSPPFNATLFSIASVLLFCAIAVAVIVYLFVQGVTYLKVSMLTTPASSGLDQSETGGFSDALIGTLLVALLGISIALPAGIAIAVWLVEYGRPAALARITESTIEAIAGIPSIVLALFGTVIFGSAALGFLSRETEGVVFGRSFFAAGAMLSLVALPLIVASVREGLNSIPRHVREASYAVGKTKAATTRRILIPTAKPQIATGAMLGLGRIIGDTAIIVVLLGATQNFGPVEGAPFPLNYLRGVGTTLTNFVYEASPTGNLNQPQKAYAAAFVLLIMVLILNGAVDVVHRRARKVGTWSH